VIHCVRPRVIIAPLQLGLGVQLHHHFASKFIIDTLFNLGFCSSYNEVTRFERSAAGTRIDGIGESTVVQFAADNVDHNIRTLDGHDTFHGMEIVAVVTAGVEL